MSLVRGTFCPLIFITLFVWEEIWSRCSRFIYIKLITTWHYNKFWWPWSPFSQTRQLPFASYKWVQDPSLHLGPNLDTTRIGGVWSLATLCSPLPAEVWTGFCRPWNVDFLMIQMISHGFIHWKDNETRFFLVFVISSAHLKEKWETEERVSFRRVDKHTWAH
jgi:hypothetical protein